MALGGVCIKILQAAADPFVTILRNSFTGPGTKIQNIFYNSLQKTCGDPIVKCRQRPLHDLVQVLLGSCCKGPGEIPSVSLHDLLHGLGEILWGPLGILPKRSSH